MKRPEKRSRTYKRSHRQAKTAADDKKLMHTEFALAITQNRKPDFG